MLVCYWYGVGSVLPDRPYEMAKVPTPVHILEIETPQRRA